MLKFGKTVVFIILLFFVFTSYLYSQADSGSFYILKWEESKGAKAYQIQVKDESGKLIVDERINKTEFKIENITQGKYEHRVGVYNKFNKLSGFSDWEGFAIVQAPTPEITGTKNFEWEEDSGIKEMNIEGNYFQKKMKITLFTSSGEEVPIHSLKIIEPSQVTLSIDTKKYSPDNYSLLFENPRNKKLKVKDFIKIIKKSVVILEPPAKEEPIPSKKDVVITEPPAKEEPPPSKKDVVTTEPPKKEEPIKISGRYPYWKEGLQSSLIPGWGQWQKEQKIKSLGFGILFWGGVGYFFSTMQDFNQAKSRYNSAVLQSSFYPILIPDQTLISLYGVRSNEDFYQQAVYKAGIVQSASIGVGVIYLFNILDALFWKTSKMDDQPVSFRPTVEFFNASVYSENKPEAMYKLNWTIRF